MKPFFLALFCLVSSTLLNPARGADIDLEWDAVDSAASYTLYCAAAGEQTFQRITGIGKTSVALTDLEEGTSYAFFVTAVDAAGRESVFSNEFDFTAPVVIPTVSVDPGIDVATVRGQKQGAATFRLSSAAAGTITVPYCLYGTGRDGKSYGLIYLQATVPAGATSLAVDIVGPTLGDPAFFSRKVYLILEASNDPSYQSSQTVLPVTVR